VAPLAADAAGTVDERAVEDEPAAATRADDHAEHRARAGARAIDGFREGKAVGIVGEADRPAELRLEIALEWPAIEPCGVGVLHEPTRRRQRSRHADADAAVPPAVCSSMCTIPATAADRGGVVVARRRYTMLGCRAAARTSATPAILLPPRSIPRRSAAVCGPGIMRAVPAGREAPGRCLPGNFATCREHEQQGFVARQMLQDRRQQLRRAGTGPNLSGIEAGNHEEALDARRLLGQERKTLYGNGFCRFPVDRLAFAPH
jgi:hypothetical protein